MYEVRRPNPSQGFPQTKVKHEERKQECQLNSDQLTNEQTVGTKEEKLEFENRKLKKLLLERDEELKKEAERNQKILNENLLLKERIKALEHQFKMRDIFSKERNMPNKLNRPNF